MCIVLLTSAAHMPCCSQTSRVPAVAAPRFLLFLAVYSFIVNNQSLSRFIRVNAMQAVLLDILLM